MLGFDCGKPIIGVVHLRPLLGSPRFNRMDTVVEKALTDVKNLEKGRIDGIMVENFGDVPFKKSVSKMTVSAMTKVANEVKEHTEVPIGINVLRNDWKAALSIAEVLDLDFIRVNVYTGVEYTAEGIIEGKAAEIQRFKEKHDINSFLLADIQVKHGEKIYPKDIKTDAVEAVERGLADGVIVSGNRTGKSVEKEDLMRVKEVVDTPVIIGSGLDMENITELLPHSDGAIVGTYLKEEGMISNTVSKERVEKMISRARDLR